MGDNFVWTLEGAQTSTAGRTAGISVVMIILLDSCSGKISEKIEYADLEEVGVS